MPLLDLIGRKRSLQYFSIHIHTPFDTFLVFGFLMGTKNRFCFDSRNEFVCR
jgi:hypothetical protein